MEMQFDDNSYLELWWPIFLVERNHLCNFGRGYNEEQFCEIILNLDQWFRKRFCLKISFIYKTLKKLNLAYSHLVIFTPVTCEYFSIVGSYHYLWVGSSLVPYSYTLITWEDRHILLKYV